MESKFIEENKDIFRCPDTKNDLMLIRRGGDNQYFVNEFETRFPVTRGFAGFVGTNSDKKVIPRYKPSKDSLSELYEKFLSSGDFLSSSFNFLVFGKKMDIVPFKNAMTVLLTELQSGIILDLPVMTGQISSTIYHNFPSMKFVAADYQVDVLSLCFDRLEKIRSDNVMLVQADPTKLPFMDGTFNAVMSFSGINFLRDYKTAFSEIYRVLREGCKFSGIAFILGEKSIADQIIEKFVSSKKIFESVFTMHELKEALANAGFKNISLTRFESDSVVRVTAVKPIVEKKEEIQKIEKAIPAPEMISPEIISEAESKIPLIPPQEIPATFPATFPAGQKEPIETGNEPHVSWEPSKAESAEPIKPEVEPPLPAPEPVEPADVSAKPLFVDAAVTPLQVAKRGRRKAMSDELDFPNILRSIDFLQNLTHDESTFIWKRMKLIYYPEKKIIIKQGDPGETFYIIKQGSVKVIARDQKGKIFLKKKLREGNFFGEMSLLIGTPRNATVKAAENVELLELTKQQFSEILKRFPSIGEKISKKIAIRQKDISERQEQKQSESEPMEAEPAKEEHAEKKIDTMSQEFLSRIKNLFPSK